VVVTGSIVVLVPGAQQAIDVQVEKRQAAIIIYAQLEHPAQVVRVFHVQDAQLEHTAKVMARLHVQHAQQGRLAQAGQEMADIQVQTAVHGL